MNQNIILKLKKEKTDIMQKELKSHWKYVTESYKLISVLGEGTHG